MSADDHNRDTAIVDEVLRYLREGDDAADFLIQRIEGLRDGTQGLRGSGPGPVGAPGPAPEEGLELDHSPWSEFMLGSKVSIVLGATGVVLGLTSLGLWAFFS